MAYTNTGGYRQRTLKVQLKRDGLNAGEERTYSILPGFIDPQDETAFADVNTTAFQKLTETQYQARLAAFLRYVYALPELEGYLEGVTVSNPAFGASSLLIGLVCVTQPESDNGGGEISS